MLEGMFLLYDCDTEGYRKMREDWCLIGSPSPPSMHQQTAISNEGEDMVVVRRSVVNLCLN